MNKAWLFASLLVLLIPGCQPAANPTAAVARKAVAATKTSAPTVNWLMV